MAAPLSQLHSEIFSRNWKTETVERQLSQEDFLVNAAQCIENRVFIGYIYMQCVAKIAEIISFGVRADCRRNGIGNKLVEYSLNELVKLNTEELFLEVAESNKFAIHLYKNFGFEIVGRRKKYYRNRGEAPGITLEDAYVMRKEMEGRMIKPQK